jgi:hypothetical protein
MRLDPRLVAVAHEAEAADGARDDELDRQDGVDLADELVADLDGRLGDGAAKLRTAVSSMDGMIRRVSVSRTLKSSGTLSSLLRGPAKRRSWSWAELLSAWYDGGASV